MVSCCIEFRVVSLSSEYNLWYFYPFYLLSFLRWAFRNSCFSFSFFRLLFFLKETNLELIQISPRTLVRLKFFFLNMEKENSFLSFTRSPFSSSFLSQWAIIAALREMLYPHPHPHHLNLHLLLPSLQTICINIFRISAYLTSSSFPSSVYFFLASLGL